ncbi:MAG: caspase family protein [Nitrospirae bacterium]|nr:caspase family protein [Nitrospirota bacterium]
MKKLSILLIAVLMFSASTYSEADRAVKVKGKEKFAETTSAVSGNYYALIIGNNNYKHLNKLSTAVEDAKVIEKVLADKFGFKTKLLLNATRAEIITSINKFKNQLRADDHFLVYYAGHGQFDKSSDKAYWLPVDAESDNPANWIIADDITAYLKRISSNHILIVSDSCYSGTFARDTGVDLGSKTDIEKYISRMLEKPSRTLMASGGNEPVSDIGGGKHSVFADAFIKGLKEANQSKITADDLFRKHIRNRVIGKADQTPQYQGIKNSGDEGGDFVFQLAKSSVTYAERLSISTEVSEESKKLQEEKEKLKKEREELEQTKALMAEKKSLEEERQKLEKEKRELTMKSIPQSDFTTGINFTGKWEVYNCGTGKYVKLDIKQVNSNISGINSNGYKFSGYYDGNKLSIQYRLESLDEVLDSFKNVTLTREVAKELVGRNDTVYIFDINKPNEKVFNGQQKRLCAEWNSIRIEKVSIDEYWGGCPAPCSTTLKRIE